MAIKINTSKLLVVLIFLISSPALGQDKTYSEEVIKKLASPEMYGRGYVNHGDQKAAHFLKEEMIKMGLKTKGNYLQSFRFDVNTYPGAMDVEIDGVELKPVTDYTIVPYSQGCKGNFKVYTPDLENWDLTKIKNDLQLIDTTHLFIAYPKTYKKTYRDDLIKLRRLGVAGFIELIPREKLSWFVVYSNMVKPKTTLMMADDLLQSNTVSKLKVNIKSKFIENYRTQNVMGYIPGKVFPDSVIVVGAHYDHLGCMGKDNYFPGADDNASGVAMVLDLARHFADEKYQPKYTIWFVLFGGEEKGLYGSTYFNSHLPVPKKQIKYMVNFDMLHEDNDHLNIINGTSEECLYQKLMDVYESKARPFRLVAKPNSPYSDHYAFVVNDISALFVSTYDMGDTAKYHVVGDDFEHFSSAYWDDIFDLMRGLIDDD
ncbi:M20/M25/M40 family metallo-hydrolase [Puteibacter caeruleilacunae]|nr:M20/M25/M40 family metallo-hydrolase [Puteibacter caeruleilacunae]